ncbi:MAG: IS30 family transposase [Bifidobacteriaceae bacterium]|jgi:IS30 family transposase|nr:IS30 family transposase [Bifidobacteriaceae bacterium]
MRCPGLKAVQRAHNSHQPRKKRRKRAGRRAGSTTSSSTARRPARSAANARAGASTPFKIDRRVSIRHRPEGCDNRTEFGHWEGDSVIGARGGAALHTEAERTTRYFAVRKVEAVTCDETVKAQLAVFGPLPEAGRLSTTMDNGTEFHHHYQVADQLAKLSRQPDPTHLAA